MELNELLRQIRLDIGDNATELSMVTIQYVGNFDANLICDYESLRVEIIGNSDIIFPFIKYPYIASVVDALSSRSDFSVTTTVQYDPMFPSHKIKKIPAVEIKTQGIDLIRTYVFSDADIEEVFLQASRFVENSSVAGTSGDIVDPDGAVIPYEDASFVATKYPSNLIHLPRYITSFFLCNMRSSRYGNIAEVDEDLEINIGDVIKLAESKKLKIADYWSRQADSFYQAYKLDGKGGGGENSVDNPVLASQFFNVVDAAIDHPSEYYYNYNSRIEVE